MLYWTIIPLAVIFDLILGDPRSWPHPVRWMGRAIATLEPKFRRLQFSLVINGGMFWLMLVGATFLLTRSVVFIAEVIDPVSAIILEIILIYYSLSARSLSKEAMGVYRALKQNDLTRAKRRVAMIVGRDTENLSSTGVAQAAVESVAENLIDGFIAPLFFAAVGGAPLALTYKMVNTLDSMVGYKNDKYYQFGKVSARMDDLFNYLPARLAIPIISLCAGIFKKGNFKRTFAMALKDGRKHTSPNAGLAEAAFAGALQVRLGGPSRYHGKVIDKPYLGKEFGPLEPDDIEKACQLMLLSALGWALMMWPLAMLML